VSWTLIDSEAAAGETASRLHAALGKPRLGYATPSFGSARRAWRRNLATDISAAVEHATGLLANAPFAATREIINILANGTDNITNGPAAARDRALARGVVINGLSLGDDPEVAAYLRSHVQGGSGSFVLEARRPVDIAGAMRRKFLLDLVEPLPDSTLPNARLDLSRIAGALRLAPPGRSEQPSAGHPTADGTRAAWVCASIIYTLSGICRKFVYTISFQGAF
jgi:Protein of unknown function (DUF1194)